MRVIEKPARRVYAMNRRSIPERIVTYGALVAGCVVFAFPFAWMILTSFKVPREMSTESLRLSPSIPRVRMLSPYIDADEYEEPERPDDVPEEVWTAARPRIEERLCEVVRAWQPRTIGPPDNPAPPIVDVAGYENEMVQGLMEMTHARISDDARGGGVDAILADVERLADDRLLEQVFDNCYRRISLGDVRIRTRDYQSHSLGESGWQVETGPAELLSRHDVPNPARQVLLRFADGWTGASFVFRADSLPVAPREIDRVYVRYRGDASWATVRLEVTRAGQSFRCREWTYLFERDWIEQELRWAGGRGDPMERRVYKLLEPHGGDPGQEVFQVRVTIEKNTCLGACLAKITRNYRQAFREVPYARYLMTSFSLVILNILLAIFACTLTGYAFARLQWPGRNLCFCVLLATMMIPAQVTMIPGFLIMKNLGWFNTLLPMWVPAAFGAPFFVFLLRQFFKNVPKDLEDAARIDGCGFLRIYWHIMLPLVKPTVATIAVFTFMAAWNNFMGPLIYVNDERLFPLALGLFKFSLRSGGDVGLMMAGSFIMTFPIILLFFFVQRYFIQGISLTGTKG